MILITLDIQPLNTSLMQIYLIFTLSLRVEIELIAMHSKAASYNTLAQLPPNKFINNQDKVLLTQEERLEALQLLGCSSWKDIEPGNYANKDDYENLY